MTVSRRVRREVDGVELAMDAPAQSSTLLCRLRVWLSHLFSSHEEAYLPLQPLAPPGKLLPRLFLYVGAALLCLVGLHFWLLYSDDAVLADRVADHLVSKLGLTQLAADAPLCAPQVGFLTDLPRRFSFPYLKRTLLVAMPHAGEARWRETVERWTGAHTGSVYRKSSPPDRRLPTREGDGIKKAEKVPFLFSYQPLHTELGKMDHGWSQVVHLLRDPFSQIASLLQEDAAANVHQVALKEAHLWREHLEYWQRAAVYDAGEWGYTLVDHDALLSSATRIETGKHFLASIGVDDPWFHQRVSSCDAALFADLPKPDVTLSFAQALEARGMTAAEQVSLEKAVFHLVNPYFCRLGWQSPSGLACTETTVPRLLSLDVPAAEQPSLLAANISWSASATREVPKVVTYPNGVQIHLLFSYYLEEEEERREELKQAFLLNINNPYIHTLHVFLDCNTALKACAEAVLPVPMDHPKLRLQATPVQLTYRDFFLYANTHLQSHLAVLHNADIVWTASIKLAAVLPLAARDAGRKKPAAFALSRHTNVPDLPALAQCHGAPSTEKSHNQNMCMQYRGSHDAFLFVPPLAEAITTSLDFKQNTWGAENTVITALREGGMDVYNPCASIVSVHQHCSGLRKRTAQRLAVPETREAMLAGRAQPSLLHSFCEDHTCDALTALLSL